MDQTTRSERISGQWKIAQCTVAQDAWACPNRVSCKHRFICLLFICRLTNDLRDGRRCCVLYRTADNLTIFIMIIMVVAVRIELIIIIVIIFDRECILYSIVQSINFPCAWKMMGGNGCQQVNDESQYAEIENRAQICTVQFVATHWTCNHYVTQTCFYYFIDNKSVHWRRILFCLQQQLS